MKIKRYFTILLATFAAALMTGCGSGILGEKISEGVITYQLEYPDGESKSTLVTVLPEKMTMAFKDDNTSMFIKGYVGSFVLNSISNYAKKQSYTTLSIGFNQKYMLVSDFGDTPFGTEPMADMKITHTADTMSICGYLCHKAVGHSDNCDRNFIFWYTKDIKIKSDCILSPVKSIDGVLMAFDVEMIGIYMKAKAIEVRREEIADEGFEKPQGFKEVSRTELEDVIHTFDGSKKKN